MSGLIAGIIGAFVGVKLHIVESAKLWPVIAATVAGYITLMISKAAWTAVFISQRIYQEQKQKAYDLDNQLKDEQTLRIKAQADFLRRSGQIEVLENRLRVVEGELEPKKRELSDAYAMIQRLHPLKDEVDTLKKIIEGKERDLVALSPPEQKPQVKFQAHGITHIQYDHTANMHTHLFDGSSNGFSIIIQILNLAVRGAYNKPVKIRAQARYKCDGETTLLSPLVWLDSPTNDVVIGPGEIRELVIARRGVHGFWDFVTHGQHGNITPIDGVDFDFEIDLVDLETGNILDVNPALDFHWHWREQHLTPHFYRIAKDTKTAVINS